jgi:hypothetical protein
MFHYMETVGNFQKINKVIVVTMKINDLSFFVFI